MNGQVKSEPLAETPLYLSIASTSNAISVKTEPNEEEFEEELNVEALIGEVNQVNVDRDEADYKIIVKMDEYLGKKKPSVKTKKPRKLKEPRYSVSRSNIPPGVSKHSYYYHRMKEKLTPEEWAQRMARQTERRHSLDPKTKEERLRRSREKRKEALAKETEEQRAIRLAKLSARTARRMMDPEKLARRREAAHESYIRRVKTETPEERKLRVSRVMESKRKRIRNETEEEREIRLMKRREETRRRAARLRGDGESSMKSSKEEEIQSFDSGTTLTENWEEEGSSIDHRSMSSSSR